MGQRRKRLPTTEEMKRRSSSMSSPSKGERSFQLFAKLAKKGDPLRITRPERLSPIALFVGPLRLLNLVLLLVPFFVSSPSSTLCKDASTIVDERQRTKHEPLGRDDGLHQVGVLIHDLLDALLLEVLKLVLSQVKQNHGPRTRDGLVLRYGTILAKHCIAALGPSPSMKPWDTGDVRPRPRRPTDAPSRWTRRSDQG